MNHKLNVGLFLCLGLALTTVGCSADTGGSFAAGDIVAQNPSGTMEGAAWTMADAVVEVDSFDENELSVTLYGTALDEECPFGLGEGSAIFFDVPRMPGEYPLSFDLSGGGRTLTFYPGGGRNLIASDGIIVVESVTETDVAIGLVAETGDSAINGKFTATLCGE